jgi:hypothetical protein
MVVVAWITCLWPGLPRLWWRGDWRALLGALAFAAALNLGLLSVLVWSQSLPGWLLAAGWAAIGLIWLPDVGPSAEQHHQNHGDDRRGHDDHTDAKL